MEAMGLMNETDTIVGTTEDEDRLDEEADAIKIQQARMVAGPRPPDQPPPAVLNKAPPTRAPVTSP